MNLDDIRGKLFNETLMEKIRDQFYHLHIDPLTQQERIFFDNAGGALRLKSANDAFKKIDEIPDCPEHSNSSAVALHKMQVRAYEDIRTIVRKYCNIPHSIYGDVRYG
ncbi:hypothetical protein QBE52_07660 [Clostridiaceae bacterium 35-E11]